MPKTVREITCCYCDAATMLDLSRIGRGVLTCDACGARLSSARMEAVVNKPVRIRRETPKSCGSSGFGWLGLSGPVGTAAHAAPPSRARPGTDTGGMYRPKKKKKKSRPKKRKSFLDRLEDIWDEIEDIID